MRCDQASLGLLCQSCLVLYLQRLRYLPSSSSSSLFLSHTDSAAPQILQISFQLIFPDSLRSFPQHLIWDLVCSNSRKCLLNGQWHGVMFGMGNSCRCVNSALTTKHWLGVRAAPHSCLVITGATGKTDRQTDRQAGRQRRREVEINTESPWPSRVHN